MQEELNLARMGWLDSIFGSGSGSGSSDHRRYSENEYYEYSRHSSGPSHSGGGFSSDSWRGPNIFEVVISASYYSSNPNICCIFMISRV